MGDLNRNKTWISFFFRKDTVTMKSKGSRRGLHRASARWRTSQELHCFSSFSIKEEVLSSRSSQEAAGWSRVDLLRLVS